MGIWAALPGRAKSVGRAGPPHPHEEGLALTRDEQRRFDEIARRIDQDEMPIPPISGAVPPRLAAVGFFLVGATGIVTGLVRGDAVVLAAVGIVPAVSATLLIALVRGRGPAPAVAPGSPVERLWSWLTATAGHRGDEADEPA
jgi:anti-sigma factor RsiW